MKKAVLRVIIKKNVFQRGAFMKRRHLIANAHIDPIWQWDIAEGVSAVLSTVRSAVNLLDEFDFVFCRGEVTVYKYIEEYAPRLFEKIRELVRLGKWHIMGGWYLQPDCNMPSGESFVRQIKEGHAYFKEKFGVVPTTAINPDPFGHTIGLVQIIKKCGQDSYIFMRPFAHELTLPHEHFIWRGLDGSEIKAARIMGYNSELGNAKQKIKELTDGCKDELDLIFWGVGNHGGGPSRQDILDIEEKFLPSKDEQYIHSTPEAFFREIEPKEIWDKSLHTAFPGCYTTMHSIKELHARLESELYLAEKMATVAYESGALGVYPEKELNAATEDLLNAEFHDVLPGTSVECGEDAGKKLLYHGLREAEKAKLRAYFALSEDECASAEGEFPIVIFNPYHYELKTVVECEFMLANQNWDDKRPSFITVKDKGGKTVLHQVIKEESNLNLDWRKRVAFEVTLSPLSLTRYSIFVDYKEKCDTPIKEEFTFDNGYKRVEIDQRTGLLKSYKIGGVEYLKDGFGLVSFEDTPDPWGKYQLDGLGKNERAFITSKVPRGPFLGMKSVQMIENGEVYLGVEAFFEDADTTARIAYKIYKNTPDIDIDISVYMNYIDRIVKLKLPIANGRNFVGQTAFGTVPIYSDGKESVVQRFTAADCNGASLALFNTSSYGVHEKGGALYTSLVRGVTYCAPPLGKDRQIIPTDKWTKKVDQGKNQFSFRLTVTERGMLENKAAEFVSKPFCMNIFPVPVARENKKPFNISVSDRRIAMPAIKKSKDSDAVIIRLLNNTEEFIKTDISVSGKTLALSFGKYEVKTVIYDGESVKESKELII